MTILQINIVNKVVNIKSRKLVWTKTKRSLTFQTFVQLTPPTYNILSLCYIDTVDFIELADGKSRLDLEFNMGEDDTVKLIRNSAGKYEFEITTHAWQ